MGTHCRVAEGTRFICIRALVPVFAIFAKRYMMSGDNTRARGFFSVCIYHRPEIFARQISRAAGVCSQKKHVYKYRSHEEDEY